MGRWFGGVRSVTTQIILLVLTLQVTATALLLVFVQFQSRASLANDQKNYVLELRDELMREYANDGRDGAAALILQRARSDPRGDAVILLTSPDGRAIAGNLREWPAVVPTDSAWRDIELFRRNGSAPERMRIITTSLPGNDRLLVGSVLESELRLRRTFEESMLAALLFSAPISLLIALAIARMLTAKLSAFVVTAYAVTTGDLERRVPRDGSGDAFDRLGQDVNTMLERIDALVTELRLVTDGLAHDLRSPLTRIRSRLEGASMRCGDEAVTADLVEIERELTGLERMLATSIQISCAEAGAGADRMVDADVSKILGDIAELFEPAARAAGYQLKMSEREEISAKVNRELLGQALANLVENAIRYAEGGDQIMLSVRKTGERIAIGVTDNGRGIPVTAHDEVRRRFVRLDPARTKPGSGLGLALVDAIARLHGGMLELEDAAPGLKATILLPVARANA